MAQKKNVQSVKKCFAILEELARSNGSLKISDISKKLKYPISTTHRFLTSLMDIGYVSQDLENGEYYLGVKLLTLSSPVLHNLDLRKVCMPFLKKLQARTGETANLVVLDSDEVMYVAKVESDAAVRVFSLIGKRAPVHATGVGKVFLANMAWPEVLEILKKKGMRKYTDNTITDIDTLMNELNIIRANNFAYDNEECEPGAKCIAAPIRNHTGKVIAGISISAPINRFTDDKINSCLDLLQKYTIEISSLLGYIDYDEENN
ncbi:MAG: IclR family transcriptional regulator [Candidatus Woesearchaeota archaeon]